MHRYIAGTCRIHLSVCPTTTWVVREASANGSQHKVDARIKEIGGASLLPASSFKGVMRTTSERILRSLHPHRPETDTPLADSVFGRGEEDLAPFSGMPRSGIADANLNAWQEANNRKPFDPWDVYAQLSPASQMFGTTLHAGLARFEDILSASAPAAVRPHISVDRFSGSVVNLFEEGANPPAPLAQTLTITNFALWHLGLFFLVLREVERGYVGFGAGTRKSHGRMLIKTTGMTFTYPAAVYPENGTGIISAQGWLAGRPNIGADVPTAVRGERELCLLPDLVPSRDGGDWRDEGLVTVDLTTNDAVTGLYREAFSGAWLPWLQRMGVPIT